MKSVKSYVLCIEQKKLLKQYNEFNKSIIHNGYYIYIFMNFGNSKTSDLIQSSR